MADLLAQYEEYLAAEKHASQNTLSSYMRDLHQFAVYLDEFHPMPLPQVTQEVISGYVAWMGGKGKSAATITRSIASIKSLYTYLQMTGEVSANPAKGVAAVKVEHKFPETSRAKRSSSSLTSPSAWTLRATATTRCSNCCTPRASASPSSFRSMKRT